ncbi:MAG: FAD-dependent monooxygenase, partial [Stackebrandtia sp.]
MRRRPNLVRTNVLVVGGGLAGLSMALFLAWHRISCVLAERNDDAVRHPRMRGLVPRVLEMVRPMGVESSLARHANRFADRERFAAVRGETRSGLLTPVADGRAAAGSDTPSPCPAIPIDQDRAERVIRQQAAGLGARVQFGSALVGFSEDETGILARLRRADGAETIVQSQYLVAADGANSAIRGQLGIDMAGPGEIGRMVSV